VYTFGVDVGPDSYKTAPSGSSGGGGHNFPNANPFSRLVITVFIIVGASMLLVNLVLIACFLKRRSEKRFHPGETN